MKRLWRRFCRWLLWRLLHEETQMVQLLNWLQGDLVDCFHYGALMYELPETCPVQDRITIVFAMMDQIWAYVEHNFGYTQEGVIAAVRKKYE